MKATILLIAAFLFCGAAGVQAQATQAFDVKVKSIQGDKNNFGQYVEEGKVTIVTFWATWCSPCKKEMDNIMTAIDEGEFDSDF